MQLSLADNLGVEKRYFLDVFVEVIYDESRDKYKLKTIEGYTFPASMRVSCPQKLIHHFPEGTIYKMDVKLIKKDGFSPYFIAVNRKNVQRAMEFYEYNIKVQNGFDYKPKPKKVYFVKEKPQPKNIQADVFETF